MNQGEVVEVPARCAGHIEPAP